MRTRPRTCTERVALVLAALAVGLASPPARADGAGADGAASEVGARLFREGKELMEAQRYELACVKFKQAREADTKATGALLNLALCHELTNRPASAWREFGRVVIESTGSREDRVVMAREHADRVFPLLSYVVVAVPPESRLQSLVVELDAEVLPNDSWGTEIAVDPGTHVVRASAPGRPDHVERFTVDRVGYRQHVLVPRLDVEPPAPASGQRTLGLVAGGVGLAAVATGLVVGLVAKNHNARAKELCANDVCPDAATKDAAYSELGAAKTTAIVSDVVVGAGAALLVAGVVLVLTSPSRAEPTVSALLSRANGWRW